MKLCHRHYWRLHPHAFPQQSDGQHAPPRVRCMRCQIREYYNHNCAERVWLSGSINFLQRLYMSRTGATRATRLTHPRPSSAKRWTLHQPLLRQEEVATTPPADISTVSTKAGREPERHLAQKRSLQTEEIRYVLEEERKVGKKSWRISLSSEF